MSNKLRFYMWLLQTIYENNGMTKKELKEMWLRSDINYAKEPISERSFFEHIKRVQEIFDVNIECRREDGYKYKIENADIISDNEIKEWMLSSFSIHNILANCKDLRKRIACEVIPAGYDLLPIIIDAMRNNLRLDMTYQTFYQESPSSLILEPYCLKVFKRRWYLLAVEKGEKLVKIYALDRVKDLAKTRETFMYPASFDVNKFFQESYGIIVEPEDNEVLDIKLKVYNMNNKTKYFRCLPLHHSQREIEIHEDYSIFEYKLKLTYDLIQEILSHGPEVEVLAPQKVRLICAKCVKEMNDLYT